jgi:stalled ribosome rescue protein Dom34
MGSASPHPGPDRGEAPPPLGSRLDAPSRLRYDHPMTSPERAAIWLDHHQARIFHVDLGGFDESKLHSPEHHFHRHPRGASEPHQHPDDETKFFASIAQALASAGDILVLGPTTAKAELLKYLQERAPAVAPKITAVEASDHPTDPELVAQIRRHFRIPIPRVL